MSWYRIPTKKEFSKNPAFKGKSFDVVFDETFVCDICMQKLQPSDAYYVVRTDDQVRQDGKPGYRHVRCDTRV